MPRTRIVGIETLIPDPHNERSQSDKEAIARLADSIRQHGLLQRLLVRPVNGKYMVVAGHRRLMAAQTAGLTHVPVEIRDIDEPTARALQVVENLHREDVTPLDEARAFDRLRGEDRTIEDVATLVGHSARYVAQRLSLVHLVPASRKALRAGTIRLGTAYALARITNPKVQKEALGYVDGSQESPLPVSRARNLILNRFETSLATAPFDPEDERLVKQAGACTTCPKRAGNQPLLFEGPDTEARCTDPQCFTRKTKAAGRKIARELKRQGHSVHSVKASRESFFDQRYRGVDLADKWVTPAQRASYETNLTWAKVLQEELEQEQTQTWCTHPDSGIVMRVIARSRAMRIAKAQGHAWAGARKKVKKSASEKKKETEAKIQRETEKKVTETLLARLDNFPFDKHVDWLVDALLDSARSDSLRRVCQAFGLKREQEIQTNYGKQRETWRDRLCRAVLGKEVQPKPLFLALLMQEQGWTYRPSNESPSLRERLITAMEVDEKGIGEKTRETVVGKTAA